MRRSDFWGDVSDAPFFCGNVPDYKAEALEQAKKDAKSYGAAYVLYNGVYYHVTVGLASVNHWKQRGYKVIHTEYSEEYKRFHGIQ